MSHDQYLRVTTGQLNFVWRSFFLKPAAANPATQPLLTDALQISVETKTAQVLSLLKNASNELVNITFANSFGAEDMVLTDIIKKIN